jgi:hypothetical protein
VLNSDGKQLPVRGLGRRIELGLHFNGEAMRLPVGGPGRMTELGLHYNEEFLRECHFQRIRMVHLRSRRFSSVMILRQ